MSSLSDYRTHNGVSLQALADFFLEQCAQAGCRGVFIVFKPEEGPNANPYSIVTNIKGVSVPDALEVVANEMRLGLQVENKVQEPS